MSSMPTSRDGNTSERSLLLFNTERKGRFLLNIRCTGQLQMSARECGVSPSTVRHHLAKDSAFQLAYQEAMDDFKEGIEVEIYRRAVFGWEEEVYQQGEFAGTMRKFDSRLLEMLAKRHIPEFKEKFEIQHHLPPGTLAVPMKQTKEEWMANVSEAEVIAEPAQDVLQGDGHSEERPRSGE